MAAFTAVGLDLGSTFSRVSLCTSVSSDSYAIISTTPDATADIVSNPDGSRATPSFAVKEAAAEGAAEGAEAWTFGDAARKLLVRKHAALVSVKDEMVANTAATGSGAKFMTYLKEMTQEASGLGASKAEQMRVVVAIPVDSAKTAGDAYKTKVLTAMKEGFGYDNALVGVITNPAAVCIANKITAKTAPTPAPFSNVLVVEWGASGCTASVLTKVGTSNVLAITSSKTDSSVGGKEIITALVAFCVTQFKRKNNLDCSSSARAMGRLRAACEAAVRTLARAASATVELDGLFEGADLRIPVSKPRFEMICDDFVNKTEELINSVVGSTKIDVVLKAGAVMDMGASGELIEKLFPGVYTGLGNVAPEEAIAMGCAMHARCIIESDVVSQANEATEKQVMLSPVEITVSAGAASQIVIGKGTSLPFIGDLVIQAEGVSSGIISFSQEKKELASVEIGEAAIKEGVRVLALLSEKGELSLNVGGNLIKL
jgi:molecular chaperone DnaK (HSP70)